MNEAWAGARFLGGRNEGLRAVKWSDLNILVAVVL